MRLDFNESQIAILNKLNFDFDYLAELTDEQVLEVDEKVTDYFSGCILEDNVISQDGLVCESIIDLIVDSE